MAGDKDWINLVGGLLKTAGSAYSTVSANTAARQDAAQQKQQYDRLAALQDPKALFAKIMQFKQSLSAMEQQKLVQSVAANIVGGGAGGATGIIQEAIADALLKADAGLFEQATQAVLASQGMASKTLVGPRPVQSGNIGNIFGSLTDLTKLLPKDTTKTPPQLPPAEDTFASFSAAQPAVGGEGG